MDLLDKILLADNVTIAELNDKISEIHSATYTSQKEYEDVLETNSNHINDQSRSLIILQEEAEKLIEEANDLNKIMTTITDMNTLKTRDIFHNLCETFDENSNNLVIVKNCIKLHKAIITAQDLHKSKLYTECIKYILDVESLFLNLDNEKFNAIRNLQHMFDSYKNEFSDNVKCVFKEYVILTGQDGCTKCSFYENKNEVQDILCALHLSDGLITLLKEFSTFVLDKVVFYLIQYKCDTEESTENSFTNISISYHENRTDWKDVSFCLKIIRFFNFLNTFFNINISDEVTAMDIFADIIKNNLEKMVMEKWLSNTIPTSIQELRSYTITSEAVTNMESKFVELKIMSQDYKPLTAFTEQIESIYIKNKHEIFFSEATEIMKRDLYDIYDSTSFETDYKISKSSVCLMNLGKNILEECLLLLTSKDVDVLFHLFTKLVKTYYTFVQMHHNKMLASIPQQIALFYNNCIFLNEEFIKLLSVENVTHHLTDDFLIECESLRESGKYLLNEYISAQSQQIEQRIKLTSFYHSKSLENIDDGLERDVRQGLRQQELLKTMWCEILPSSVYNQAIGSLLKTLCMSLMNPVLTLEDISCSGAEKLSNVLKIIKTRGPNSFTNHDEVYLHVDVWAKFNELIFILGASLLDINDRWANGKGTLALHFQPNELKQLIRAIFQNTERRANLLAKIH